jgi:hypothetical protein
MRYYTKSIYTYATLINNKEQIFFALMSIEQVRQLVDDIFDCNTRDMDQVQQILGRIEDLIPFLNENTLQMEKYVNPFLVKLLSKEELTDQVSNLMAQLCGRIALGETTSTFEFSDFSIVLRETTYTEAEIGFQTWGGGILLSKYRSLT